MEAENERAWDKPEKIQTVRVGDRRLRTKARGVEGSQRTTVSTKPRGEYFENSEWLIVSTAVTAVLATTTKMHPQGEQC